jgi:aminopeptidase YwaD
MGKQIDFLILLKHMNFKQLIRFYFLLLLTFLFFQSLFAQDIDYARKIIDTLCSSSMHGRGYVNNGDQIAAVYISNEFKTDNLKSFSTGYFQNFTLPISTLPGKVMAGLGKSKMLPVIDYLV